MISFQSDVNSNLKTIREHVAAIIASLYPHPLICDVVYEADEPCYLVSVNFGGMIPMFYVKRITEQLETTFDCGSLIYVKEDSIIVRFLVRQSISRSI